MHQPPTLRLSTWARLVGLALLLVVGVLASLGLASRTAHAQPAATLSVTDCSGEFGPGRIGTVISSASAGDRITFSCSGTIPITSTLTISTNNLTLDGSGQAVTLDGGNSMEVLSVNSGVTFTLNALTIANGAGADCGELCSLAGGLENGGTVSISNSTFANNSTLIGGGGLQNFGGTVSISNSTFANNSAGFGGGGLDNEFGTVSISNSTFANNLTFNSGGGGLSNCCGGGTMSISNSIVANNSGGTALVRSPIRATTWRVAATVALPARAIYRTPIPNWPPPWPLMGGPPRPWPCWTAARPLTTFRPVPALSPPTSAA